MEDFRKLLKETEDSIKSKEIMRKRGLKIGYTYRKFEGLHIGNYTISIQASESHYCEPRKTLENLNDYKSMEIALFDNNGWLQPHTDERFKNFNRLNELLDRYEDGDIAVGGYVDIDLIQDLCNYLESL